RARRRRRRRAAREGRPARLLPGRVPRLRVRGQAGRPLRRRRRALRRRDRRPRRARPLRGLARRHPGVPRLLRRRPLHPGRARAPWLRAQRQPGRGRLVAGAARCPNIWRMTRGTRTFSLALALALTAPAALAQGAPGGDPMPAPADLPVTRVVLFTSGVAYFEHEGTVVGDRAFELSVPPSEMDDMLQTLVLQDLDGGTIEPVTYDSREPLGRILAGYSIDLSGAPTLAQILGQLRGEVVHLEASRPLTGAIVSVERVEAPEEAPRTFLTLATSGGLTRVDLAEITSVRLD